ncbi:MAG: FkbM family methyltransferase, partial [Endomicrobiaceae bacterium]|nr:FkbM family methyltransferase [Endomicrobiaceae bacterium]
IKLSTNDVFIDCGASNGDTIFQFIKECKGKYKKIVAFEINPNNLKASIVKKTNNLTVFNLGVWNKKEKQLILENQTNPRSSKIEQVKVSYTVPDIYKNIKQNIKKNTIEVDAIDNIKECADMTFLKMDIEGSELMALKGAEKTIRKNKPKLAISIYHSDEDILDIPEWIINLNMNYKIYIRHHSFASPSELICYAI